MPDSAQPPLAALRALFARVVEAQHAATVAVLDAAPAERAAEHSVADAFRRADELLAARADGIACAAGCPACCHQAVAVTAAEAIALADALREAFPAEWIAELRRALAQRAARVAGFADARAYRAARLPCAFLGRDGSCGAYDWRPVVCRGHRSTSRAACEAALADPDARAAGDDYGHVAGNAVLDGLRAAFAARGRDAAVYELHGAVLRALEAPRAAERWAAGEDVLAGCDRRLVGPDARR